MSTRQGTNTRAIAIDALTHILTRNMHADAALDRLFSQHPELRTLDKAFIFEMVYGSLRWLSKMDWITSHMTTRPLASLDPRVANAIRIGTYQIFYMDRVPDRAAVSETVEAVKKIGATNATSFVNAILRRVARKAEYFPKPDKVTQTAEYLAMHMAHPKWMVDRWIQNIAVDRLEFVLSGNNTAPKNSLRIISKNPVPSGEDLATYLLRSFGIHSEWRPLKKVLRVASLPPFGICEAFKAGCYMVQDEAAQLAVSLVNVSSTDTVLDACAAPGGKSIALWDSGALTQNMLLCDFSQKRINLLQSNLKRVGLDDVPIAHGDVTLVAQGKTFSKIVLDAPCSSMGVIRRHPEIKWLRSPADITQCAIEQERLLAGLAPAVAPNGELIYIVCSNEAEETVLQSEKFLNRHPQFEVVTLDGRVHDYYRKYVTRRNELLILPGNSDELDGFYAIVFKRRS